MTRRLDKNLLGKNGSHMNASASCPYTKQESHIAPIIINANGVVVCREWKKCEGYKKGKCPVYKMQQDIINKVAEKRYITHK